MPSQSVLEAKKAVVADLTERLNNSVTGVVVSYEGINVEDDTKLRKELREAGVNYTVVKNTLLTRACENAGLQEIVPTLNGTTAIATSDEDYAAAARILCGYAKDHDNFKIKTGYMDGAVVDMDTIIGLSKLPTRDVLLANVLGAFQAPIAAFARVVQALVDKGGAIPAEKEEAPAEDAAPSEEAKEAPAEDAAPAEEVKEAPAEDAAPAEEAKEAPAEETKEEAAE